MSDKPEELRLFPSIYEHKVQWGEMDAFQHVNNTTYFRYFESGRIQYMHDTGYMAMMKTTGCGPILADVYCKFKMPVEFPDNLLVATKISDLKETEFTMQHLVYSISKQCIAAEGHGKIVHYNYKLKLRSHLPSELVSTIKTLQPELASLK